MLETMIDFINHHRTLRKTDLFMKPLTEKERRRKLVEC